MKIIDIIQENGLPCPIHTIRKRLNQTVLYGYSSFPEWSPLRKIKETELDRGNYFPDTTMFNKDLPAKWMTESKLIAYSYSILAEHSSRIRKGQLTGSERQEMYEIVCKIPLKDTDIIIIEDGDEGFLVVRLDAS